MIPIPYGTYCIFGTFGTTKLIQQILHLTQDQYTEAFVVDKNPNSHYETCTPRTTCVSDMKTMLAKPFENRVFIVEDDHTLPMAFIYNSRHHNCWVLLLVKHAAHLSRFRHYVEGFLLAHSIALNDPEVRGVFGLSRKNALSMQQVGKTIFFLSSKDYVVLDQYKNVQPRGDFLHGERALWIHELVSIVNGILPLAETIAKYLQLKKCCRTCEAHIYEGEGNERSRA